MHVDKMIALATKLGVDYSIVKEAFDSVMEPPLIRSSFDAVKIMEKWQNKNQEHFIVILLDAKHSVIRAIEATRGLVNRTLIHPREVFAPAIRARAAAVIIAHNHPSGRIDPTPEDDDVTRRMIESGKLIGIPVLDHIIVGRNETEHYSYKAQGRFNL